MQVSRKFPGVEVISGIIYAIGGRDSTYHVSVERYVPDLNQWSMAAPLLGPRSAMGVVAWRGFLYVLGGHDGTNCLASVERYDPLCNEWTQVPTMSTAREGVCAVVLDVEQHHHHHQQQQQQQQSSNSNSSSSGSAAVATIQSCTSPTAVE